jgi:hypothetical protein
LAQISIGDPANALTRYFNCVTRAANINRSLLLENAEVCYDKVFKGAADNDEFGRISSNHSSLALHQQST